MSVTATQQKTGDAARQGLAQPRENLKGSATIIDPLMEKTFFLVREGGGKRHEVKGRLMRIHIAPGGYVELTYLAGGVWSQVLTTPFDFEIATCAPEGL
jgi:hypothetical protein